MASDRNFNIDFFCNSMFRVDNEHEFNELALELFYFQYENNSLYRAYCDLLRSVPEQLHDYRGIPFLPIEFFRDHEVVTPPKNMSTGTSRTFLSSATTGSTPSRHVVTDTRLYERSFTEGFRRFYGDPEEYCFLALLPGYLERPDSSLAYMMEHFVGLTQESGSGFYLNNPAELSEKILERKSAGKRLILFGVTFALLDLAERFPMDLEGVIIMETGGMKGRRKEIIRKELHEILCKAFNVQAIHSEYGMTELLSQAYSSGGGLFRPPPWMKAMARDVNDPLSLASGRGTGGLNIIDLANVHSCAFIATQDLGRCHDNGSFEVLGRFDGSDVRGCSLMVT